MKRFTEKLSLITAAFLLFFSAANAFGSTDSSDLSSVDFASSLTIGWNLGNTLDAASTGSKGNMGTGTETSWGLPKTTQAMIKAVSAAGFKTIRIPVSWHNHIKNSSLTIDPAWLARVKQIVDWAKEENMYVIINIHHDNMQISQIKRNTDYGYALTDDAAIQAKSKAYLSAVWKQVAETFASYDEKLIFEVLNEPRDKGGEFGGNEWWTNNKALVDVITDYEQTCIDTIRSVGGNENRFIMVPGYAGSGADTSMLSLYEMPSDTAEDKLLLSAHAYSPFNFAMYNSNDSSHTAFTNDDRNSLDAMFSYLERNYINKGIGVVMGEASASDKNNLNERIEWAEYYFGKAKEAGIPVVLWDNNVTMSNGGTLSSGECHGYFNRRNCSWYFPSLISAMMNAAN